MWCTRSPAQTACGLTKARQEDPLKPKKRNMLEMLPITPAVQISWTTHGNTTTRLTLVKEKSLIKVTSEFEKH